MDDRTKDDLVVHSKCLKQQMNHENNLDIAMVVLRGEHILTTMKKSGVLASVPTYRGI